MKKFVIPMMVVVLSLCLVLPALAEKRMHKGKEFFFGDSFHKSPCGVKINFPEIGWDEKGANFLHYKISAWKSKIVWDDIYLIGMKEDKKVIVYKYSDKKKLGLEFCYSGCLHKVSEDTIFIEPPAAPFDLENGEVWWVFSHGGQKYHIVWTMHDNAWNWYKAEDKPAPPVAK